MARPLRRLVQAAGYGKYGCHDAIGDKTDDDGDRHHDEGRDERGDDQHLLVQFAFVDVGDIAHRLCKTPGLFAYRRHVRKQFGEKFAAKLDELTPGSWQGPVESGYGVHLVLISERTEGRMPELAEVRDSVSREWVNTRRLKANEKYFQDLLKHYAVTVEPPDPAAAKRWPRLE